MGPAWTAYDLLRHVGAPIDSSSSSAAPLLEAGRRFSWVQSLKFALKSELKIGANRQLRIDKLRMVKPVLGMRCRVLKIQHHTS